MKVDLRANLIGDPHLAALAIEHGPRVYSVDSDFAEITRVNPLQAA